MDQRHRKPWRNWHQFHSVFLIFIHLSGKANHRSSALLPQFDNTASQKPSNDKDTYGPKVDHTEHAVAIGQFNKDSGAIEPSEDSAVAM